MEEADDELVVYGMGREGVTQSENNSKWLVYFAVELE